MKKYTKNIKILVENMMTILLYTQNNIQLGIDIFKVQHLSTIKINKLIHANVKIDTEIHLIYYFLFNLLSYFFIYLLFIKQENFNFFIKLFIINNITNTLSNLMADNSQNIESNKDKIQ